MARECLRVIPLGGLGEIGKNMMALETGDDLVVIDCGVMFPEEDMLGVDLVLPDITYLLERKEKVRGILITHGHEDHIGALPFVLARLPVPVYAVGLAHDLVRVKLKEHRQARHARLVEVQPGKPFRLGRLTVEFFRVCHSIPDACGIAIQTPLGLVVHTGDFKIDHTPVDGRPTDFGVLAEMASRGVFLLFSDSTYAEVPGYTPSEQVVGDALDFYIGQAPGRVMVATFASLISRIQQVVDAAVRHGRQVAVLGRSMVDNVEMALKKGYLRAPEGTIRPWKEVRRLPPEKVVLLLTGSQGEPTSVLVRIANRDHPEVSVQPGDTVIISASPIPGNETVVARTIDNLMRQGARVLYSRIATVHVHGHASQEELKLMLNLVRPRFFVPVHGEYRHLVAHAQLAQSLGLPGERVFVLEDGDVLELTRDGGRIVGRVSAGHIYIDGMRGLDIGSGVLRDRQALSREGVVVVVLAVDRHTGALVREPQLLTAGVLEATEELEALLGRVRQALADALDHRRAVPLEWSFLNAKVKEVVGHFFQREVGRRPLILPAVVEV